MFGGHFKSFVAESAPELDRLDIRIADQPVLLSDLDRVNALAVRNNFLCAGKEQVGIFYPQGTLTEILMLVAAGLAAYRSVLGGGALSEADFKPGSLVLYQGELVRFVGWDGDSLDGGKKFVLANEDRYKTRTILPASQLSELSKYSGTRTEPDPAGAHSRMPAIQKTIAALFGFEENQQLQLANYPAIAVCLKNPALIGLLKETTVNGIKFFELFPSVRWTAGREWRQGRDQKKRSFVFYFFGSISVADDALRTEGTSIRVLIADSGKTLRAASLVSSMLSGGIEKIYTADDTGSFETALRLKKLGFKILFWTMRDFQNMHVEEYVRTSIGMPGSVVYSHNNAIQALRSTSFSVYEVRYPAGFSIEQHARVQQCITVLKQGNDTQQSESLDDFLKSGYGLLNKLFQVPLPPELLGAGAPWDINAHLEQLKIKAVLVRGTLSPQGLQHLDSFLEIIQTAVPVFSKDRSKYEVLRGLASTGGACLLVKRPQLIEPLEKLLAVDGYQEPLAICAYPQKAVCYERIVWTFRPDLRNFASGMFKARESAFVGYPLQIAEWKAVYRQYESIVEAFSTVHARAAVLKIDPSVFDAPPEEAFVAVPAEEVFAGLEEELLSTRPFLYNGGLRASGEAGTVTARQVLFTGGFTAFFELGKLVKVLEAEGEDVVQKTVVELHQGDKVVFIKDERETIFDELVEYYRHRPDVVEILELSEKWRTTLRQYFAKERLTVSGLKLVLENAGLGRTEASIENWLAGKVICPPENNYHPIDVIAAVTGDGVLAREKEKVKEAARKVHSMRIKIGRYLAKHIAQSAAAIGDMEGDSVLREKLDKISSYAEVAEVAAVAPEEVEVSPSVANRLLGTEDF
jgi:hypothetical protein